MLSTKGEKRTRIASGTPNYQRMFVFFSLLYACAADISIKNINLIFAIHNPVYRKYKACFYPKNHSNI